MSRIVSTNTYKLRLKLRKMRKKESANNTIRQELEDRKLIYKNMGYV